MKLKVCGMREAHNINALVRLEPDYMGFIFWEPSKRYCTEVPNGIPDGIQKVGVFVDETSENIRAKVRKFSLQAVQLHGHETPEQCNELQAHCEVIKAFRIGPGFDFKTLEPYQNVCAYFLFDTQGPLPGGNGKSFDWQLLENYTLDTPFFLSGGIGLDHVAAIAEIRKRDWPLYGLDINSQFESEPGLKNIDALQEFKNHLQL